MYPSPSASTVDKDECEIDGEGVEDDEDAGDADGVNFRRRGAAGPDGRRRGMVFEYF